MPKIGCGETLVEQGRRKIDPLDAWCSGAGHPSLCGSESRTMDGAPPPPYARYWAPLTNNVLDFLPQCLSFPLVFLINMESILEHNHTPSPSQFIPGSELILKYVKA